MSDTDERQQAVKVNDRRRFDPEGNSKEGAKEAKPSDAGPKGAQAGTPPPPAAPAADPLVIQLTQDLEAARKRVDDLARAYQALEKDREEFKQRLTRERERMIDVEKGNVVQLVLEAVDELDLCLGASNGDESPLAKGVRMIRDKLLRKLETEGVERLALEGRPYDPGTAEAADMEVTDREEDDGMVVAEVRAGYRLKERVIRPARVKVARYVRPASA